MGGKTDPDKGGGSRLLGTTKDCFVGGVKTCQGSGLSQKKGLQEVPLTTFAADQNNTQGWNKGGKEGGFNSHIKFGYGTA